MNTILIIGSYIVTFLLGRIYGISECKKIIITEYKKIIDKYIK